MSVALEKNREPRATDKAMTVHVAESGTRTPKRTLRCELGPEHRLLDPQPRVLFFAAWDAAAYDALLVAAAVEFADKAQKRQAHYWPREFHLSVPVHDVARWSGARVHGALLDALNFLTGDRWEIEFYPRRRSAHVPQQGTLESRPLRRGSHPLQQRSGFTRRRGSDRPVDGRWPRARPAGSRLTDGEALARERHAFSIAVPFDVTAEKGAFVESTVRSRGFKFALVSGLAASSGRRGTGHRPGERAGRAWPVACHRRPGLRGLSQPSVVHRADGEIPQGPPRTRGPLWFPQIWQTKGETLRSSRMLPGYAWASTWSCWQSQRQVSVDGRKRQCGVCAACMLRRMSIHAGRDLVERAERYVWEGLRRGPSRTALNRLPRQGRHRRPTTFMTWVSSSARCAASASAPSRLAGLLLAFLKQPVRLLNAMSDYRGTRLRRSELRL